MIHLLSQLSCNIWHVFKFYRLMETEISRILLLTWDKYSRQLLKEISVSLFFFQYICKHYIKKKKTFDIMSNLPCICNFRNTWTKSETCKTESSTQAPNTSQNLRPQGSKEGEVCGVCWRSCDSSSTHHRQQRRGQETRTTRGSHHLPGRYAIIKPHHCSSTNQTAPSFIDKRPQKSKFNHVCFSIPRWAGQWEGNTSQEDSGPLQGGGPPVYGRHPEVTDSKQRHRRRQVEHDWITSVQGRNGTTGDLTHSYKMKLEIWNTKWKWSWNVF